MPLPRAQGDAREHGTGAALQPGLQAGLTPTQEKQSPWTRGLVHGQERWTFGSAGG